ncbi:MAG: CBS domain-containing protein [Dehalococcoidia bacterium]
MEESRSRGIPDLTVADVMSFPLVTIEAEVSLSHARDLLEQYHCHHLVVTNGGSPVAVVSDRDIIRALSPFLGTIVEQARDQHTLLRPVLHVATFHPVTVHRSASIYEAAATLLERGISCLPVVDDMGRIVGIVTSSDLMRGMLSCRLPATGPTLADVA